MSSSTQTNTASPDSPKNTLSSKSLKDEDFTALPSLSGHQHPLPTSTINHDPFGHPDPKQQQRMPSHYATVSDSILGYANKAHDMVLGPSGNKSRSTSTEDQAREMIGTGIPTYSFDKRPMGMGMKSSSLSAPLPDRNLTHSPTLYQTIAADNPASSFGEPEDDMALYEARKYRATHPFPKAAPLDTHLMDMIADVQYNNGGFDEAEDAMAMYEASKYHSLHTEQREKEMEKQRDKENTKSLNKSRMVLADWADM